MEKIRSLVGMVSKKKFFSACKCYENNKYGVDYVKIVNTAAKLYVMIKE